VNHNEQAARLGLPLDLVQDSEQARWCDGIFLDNIPVVGVFRDMLTQWRVGAAGATGLDYSALPVVFRVRGIRGADRADVFDGLQIMERAALAAMRENR
jgi:hypothetical protein